jgi:hypothetical protein
MEAIMTDAEFRKAFAQYMQELYDSSKLEARGSANHNWTPGTLPYHSGNLSQQAFRLEKDPSGNYKLTIDSGMAPYAQYVNDKESFYTHNFWRLFAAKTATLIAAYCNSQATDNLTGQDLGGSANDQND